MAKTNTIFMNIQIDCQDEHSLFDKLDIFIQFLLKNNLTGSLQISINRNVIEFDDDDED